MASILDLLKAKGLTKPALVNQNGQPQFYNNDQGAMDAGAQALAATPQEPSVSTTQPQVTGVAPDQGPGWVPPDGSQIAAPSGDAPPNLQFAGGQMNISDPSEKALPKYADPSFHDRITDAYGNVTKGATPGLTKLGVFAKVLNGMIQGDLDAVSSGALNAERGKSSFGAGAQGAAEMPFMRALRAQQQQKGQLENQQLQNQVTAYAQPVTLDNGQTVPFGRAKQITDLQHVQAQTAAEKARGNYWNSASGAKDQLDLSHLYAQAVQNGDEDGANKLADAITAIQRQPHGAAPNDLAVWRQQNPTAPITDYWKQKANTQNASRAAYRDPGSDDGTDDGTDSYTRSHIAAADNRKNSFLLSLQQQYSPTHDGQYRNVKTAEVIPADEFNHQKQMIQDSYEQSVSDLVGHPVPHFDYSAQQQQANTTPTTPNQGTPGFAIPAIPALLGGKRTPAQLGTKNLPRVADVNASPQSHVFSKSAWLKSNPGGDVNAAAQQATNSGFEVTQ